MRLRARFDDLIAGRAFEFDGLEKVLICERADDVPDLLREVDAAVATGRYVAGFVAYEAAPGFDASLRVCAADDAATPLACFGLYSTQREIRPVTPLNEALDGQWTRKSSAAEHESSVRFVKARIRAGWTYQTNVTIGMERHFDADPFVLYRQLATAQRSAYNAYLESEEWAIACASPELFFTLEDGTVTTRPMKGTARRGRFRSEDDDAARALSSSTKERAENLMIVDLIRNDLGRIAQVGSVEVPELFRLERYPTVWQMTSTVTARVEHSRIADIFAALFPCGSVTGAPKVSTMAVIADIERSARGVYCGAVGYALPGQSPVARFAVAIRTATIDRLRHTATYGVGGGITFDSDPQAEWEEIGAKARILTEPPASFDLIETFRYEEDGGFIHLERHLDRLARSADHFGFAFSRQRTLAAIYAQVPRSLKIARARVALALDGSIDVQVTELDVIATPLVLAVDDEPVDECDERLFHKTTDRSRYELAAARHPDADDVVLRNRAGQLTETTRANLALCLEGRWCTPPLSSGLLPGIERARLLEKGILIERVMTIADLDRATGLATLSSLRGWREAVLAPRYVAVSDRPGTAN